jgi:DNA polymerase III subunit beta
VLEGISGEKRVLIPRKALQELQQLLGNTEAEKVEFADDEHTLFFRVGHRTLSTRKLSGQFPNFEAVMPRDNTKFAVVRSSELSRPFSAWRSLPTSARAPSSCGSKATS